DIAPAFFTIAVAVLGSTLVFLTLPRDAGAEIGNVGRPRDTR
ncbi:MAG: hypothetical protein RJB09_771, partial [Pseudomonadota bacterium]